MLLRDGINIKVCEMVVDSRCPTGTDCIWAGNANVKVSVTSGLRTQIFELNSNTQPTSIKFSGFDIKLSGLEPRPAANVRIDPSKFVATFDVTKDPRK